MRSAQEAEQDARTVLLNYWADPSGALPAPVDPVRIARSMGLDVFAATMERDVSGVLFKQHGVPTIHVNALDAPVRQRFTCAHEIGHYYLHLIEGDEEYGYVDERGMLSTQGIDAGEIYANRFAAALLMPPELLDRVGRRNPVRAASLLGVSLAAMTHRLATPGV